MDELRLFSGLANRELSERISAHLGVPLGKMTVSSFSDGEISVKIDESARGQDIFLIQPTCRPINDNLVQLLIMVDAFRRASARRITVVMPYYGYARQDKKVKPREPITARMIANIITNAGANRVLTLDLHAGQIQGFFDIPVDHLTAGPLIADEILRLGLRTDDTVVVSPDVGGVTRARALAERIDTPIAIIAKRRPAANQVEIMEIIGDIQGKVCLMIDDMIDTGGSIVQGAEKLIQRGAREVHACCTHGVLSGEAIPRIQASVLSSLLTTDSIPLPDDLNAPKIRVISVAPLLADAIDRIHRGDSVSVLFQRFGTY